MSASSGGSSGTANVTTNVVRPQEPPPPTPSQESQQKEGPPDAEEKSEQSPGASPVANKRNIAVAMIPNEDKKGGRPAGIDNPWFEEDYLPATVGNGDSVFISVTSPSNGNSSSLISSGIDTSMLKEMKEGETKKDKRVAEAVNLELVSMNPFSATLETNGLTGIPVKKDGEQNDISDGYADPYDEYFVPVNEHRKYMRGEKLYVTKDKRQSQSWRRCICWGCGFILLSVAILIAVLAGTGVILSQENQTLVTEKTETGRQLGTGNDGPWIGANLDKAGGKGEPPSSEASSITPPPSILTGMPSMPTTDMSLLYVPRVLDSELVIDNVQFNHQLTVSGSEEFRNMAESLEEELRRALFDVQTLRYGAADIFIKVVEFSSGSVVAKFRVGWEFKEGIRKAPDPIHKDTVRQRLERQLNLNGGVLGLYHIPTGSIRVNRLLDACQFNNGNCSHECTFDYRNKMAFVCECPAGLHLQASGQTCTDVVPAEREVTLTHGREPAPDPVSEPAPEPSAEPAPEPEPSGTSTLSTAAAAPSSSNEQHSGHTTTGAKHSDYSTMIPTVQQSSADHHNHSSDGNVAVTTAVYSEQQDTVDVAEDYSLLSPHTHTETLQSHTVDGNNSVMIVNHHSHRIEVPAAVHMIFDDVTTNMGKSSHAPVKDEELGSTLSPHLRTETQTFVVNVTNKHSTFEYPNDTGIGHRDNESNMKTASERDKPPAGGLSVFTSHETQSEAGIVTTGVSATSEPQEFHTDISVEHAEAVDKPIDKKRGFMHDLLENKLKYVNSSAGKISDALDTSENTTAGQTEHETGTNSSKLQAADNPVRIVDPENEEHDNMFTSVQAESDTKIVPNSSNKMTSIPPTQLAGRETQKHVSDFFNDLHLPHREHAENDTFLNALSAEDYENNAAKTDNVANITLIPNLNLKKGARLDDDDMSEVHSSQYEHTASSEPSADSAPITETSYRQASTPDNGQILSKSQDIKHHFAPVTKDIEHGNAKFWTVEHLDLATNKSGDVDGHDMLPYMVENVTKLPVMETALMPNEQNLSELLEGTMKQVDKDITLTESVSEHTSEHTFTVAGSSTDASLAAVYESFSTDIISVEEADHIASDSTIKDVEMTTMPTSGPVNTLEGKSRYSVLVKDSNNSSESKIKSSVGENAIETGEDLHLSFFSTTTESELDHFLTVAPLPEHDDGETMPGDKQSPEMTTQMEFVDVTTKDLPLYKQDSTAASGDSMVTQSVFGMLTAKTSPALPSESPNIMTTIVPHEENDISSSADRNSDKRKIDPGIIQMPGNMQQNVTNIGDGARTNTVASVVQSGETNVLALHKDTATTTDSTDKTEKDGVNNVNVSGKINSAFSLSSDTVGTSSAAPDTIGISSAAQDTVGISSAAPDTVGISSAATDTVGISSAAPDTIGISSAAAGTVGISSAAPGTVGISSAAPDTIGISSAVPDTVYTSTAPPDTAGISSAAQETFDKSSAVPYTVGSSADQDAIGISSAAPDTVGISSTSPDTAGISAAPSSVGISSSSSDKSEETPSQSDKEAEDVDLLRGRPPEEHVNTVRPLPLNVSLTHSYQEPILQVLSNNTGTDSHGNFGTSVTYSNSSDFEKPHAFTDIENKLLVDSGKVHNVTMSMTTEYANEIHALPPSGGGNVIPPTGQSTLLVDPTTDEIQNPSVVGLAKKKTLPVNITEDHSPVEHTEKSENFTTLRMDKDASAVSVNKPEPKKKEFLNVSINKKPLKFTGDTSSLQGENDQLFTDKSTVSVYEKKPVDKLQKFDKDNNKKIDKIGFAVLPTGDKAFDEQDAALEDGDTTAPVKEVSARTTAIVSQGANSTAQVSSLADAESRPVDEDDDNEDLLTSLRTDVEHVNVVETQGVVRKDKGPHIGGNKAYILGGEAVRNESVDDQHVLARNDMGKTVAGVQRQAESSIAVGIEPAIAIGRNATSELTDGLFTPRILPAGQSTFPQIAMNMSLSSDVASVDEKLKDTKLPTDGMSVNFNTHNTSLKALDGHITDNTTISGNDFVSSMNSQSTDILSNVAGNISVINPNFGTVIATDQEDGNPGVTTAAFPVMLSTNVTSSDSPEAPASTVVTLNNKDFVMLHKGIVTPEHNWTVDTTDAPPSASSYGTIRNWTADSNITAGRSAVLEPPTSFSKCASGQFQCVNGTSHEGAYCVGQVAKCDSVKDCSDGSDEMGCVEDGCPGNFQCSSGQCLKRQLVCNGIVDCNDGSDEVNCEKWHCQFDEFQCSSGRCIPFLWHCDGKPDCDNHTDEYNCMSSCGNDEYLCAEQWCIPMAWRCNGIAECASGEDEKLCDCSLDQFRCNTGGCVPKVQVCDGVDHCPDRSDEWGCVGLHNDTMKLQIRSAEGTWHPVCGDGWEVSWSDVACQSLGYSKATFTEYPLVSDSVGEYYTLKPGIAAPLGGASLRLTSALQISDNEAACTSGTVVEIACQEFTCGSHGLADAVAARLVGGDGATNGQWPSVALLYHTRYRASCTTSIISPKWLLSSYNCLHLRDKTLTAENWVAFGGGSMFESDKPDTQIREVRSIIPYPQVKYNQFLYNNDIALIELSQPLIFTRNVGAICLPEKEIEPRQLCVTAGWGYTSPGEINFSQYLHYLPVPTIDLRDCNSTKHYAGFITDVEICAGFTDAEKSPCYNDEGAPLMCVSEGGVWELQGVLSYHSNCGQGYHPSIFSSITAVRGWVEKTVGSRFERKSTFNVRRR